MKKLHTFFADTIFVAHCFVGIFIAVGWMFPKIKIFYLIFMALLLSSWIFLNYCPLSKWEFALRKKYDETVDIDTEIIQHYAYKFFKLKIPSKFIFVLGLFAYIVLVFLTMIVN
ncbi:MAG: DUF2784 family protein [Candidatus Paceibacterota bacterium]|jgi:hypothetical protein